MIDYSVFDGIGFPKAGKVGLRAERVEKSHGRKEAERTAKKKSKALTVGRCRWPHRTAAEKRLCAASPKESAHLKDKGIGGDHGKRSKPEDHVTVCQPVHQGPGSIHDKKKRITPLTEFKGFGACLFEEKVKGKWVVAGEETSVGVMKR